MNLSNGQDVISRLPQRFQDNGLDGHEFVFMKAIARPHRANIVDECLQSEDITLEDRPPFSPDFNPVELVRNMLD
ncbi:hypothetical protein TNCV_1444231 [Trichonephila clavipes]|nr:hypothetical protein TNCV_1444231 [Trichonephila clavipes]